MAVQVDVGCWIIDSIAELVGGLLEPSLTFSTCPSQGVLLKADGRWQVADAKRYMVDPLAAIDVVSRQLFVVVAVSIAAASGVYVVVEVSSGIIERDLV